MTAPPRVDRATQEQLARYESLILLATSIAQRTSGEPTVMQRHLVAAGLIRAELPDSLVAALHCDGTELRLRLRSAVADCVPSDRLQAWESVLGLSQLESPFTSDHVPVVWRRGDPLAPRLPDQLNFDVYVTMLATMIARESTAMPVSIGLFGEWGSGKSYFMELLRQKVEELTGEPGPYLRDIVPIAFNAWSYADTNLWASLAADSSSNWARQKSTRTSPAVLRFRSRSRRIIRFAQYSCWSAIPRRSVRRRRATAAKAVLDRETKTRMFNVKLITAVAADAAVQAKLVELGEKLGFGTEGQERALKIATDVQGITDDLTATRRVLAQRS